MLRGWLAFVAVLAGIGISWAAEIETALVREPKWEQARQHLAEGKPAEARAALETLIGAYSDHPDLHFALALTALRMRKPDAAQAAVQRALALDPAHAQARTLLGWIELEIRGNSEAAIRQYSQVVALRPEEPDAHVNLGAARKKSGDLNGAIASYNEALRLRSDHAPALTNRGWAYVEQQRWPEAKKDFERVLELNPNDPAALQGLAQVLEKTRDYAAAQAALESLMSSSPNFVFWLQWGRIGLIRYYWVILLIAIAIFFAGRVRKARHATNGG